MIAQASIEHLPIVDDSVGLIFTDPPYAKDALPCYGWLAQEAMRVLKPGGFVLAMCGGTFINQIFRMFDGAGLTYFWKCEVEKASYNPGLVWLHGKPICNFIKSIIVYSKGVPGMENVTGNFSDLYSQRTMPNKRYHHWGQNTGNAIYYISAFSMPGALVLDPFIGGGTTAVACQLIGRRWLALDIDPEALSITRGRMSETEFPHMLPLFTLKQEQGSEY